MKFNNTTKNILSGLLSIAFVASIFAYNLYSQQQDPAKTQPAPQTSSQESAPAKDDKPWQNTLKGWRVDDYKPYMKAMRDLQKVSAEYSEIILKLAMDEYSTGLDLLEDMENEVFRLKKRNKQKKNLNEKWYWQEVDRKNQENRKIGMMKREAKMKSITHFVKSIQNIDDVSSKDINERAEFINFKIRLYQIYVSTQYDLQNFLQCIPILERYITITDETRKDPWAYKYLSNCYAFMEAVLVKYKHATPDKIMAYKQKKNKCLLKAAEIQFGVDSVEYKHLNEIVQKDEIRSERLNNYR